MEKVDPPPMSEVDYC